MITEDGRTLIIAESAAAKLTAFDRAEDGTLGHRREWAALGSVAPDGICLCADGTIWVSNAYAPECVRVAEGGEVLERVVTSMNCYACMLGDDDRRTLYLVTAPASHAVGRPGGAQGRHREGAHRPSRAPAFPERPPSRTNLP